MPTIDSAVLNRKLTLTTQPRLPSHSGDKPMKTTVIALLAVLAISFGVCGLTSHYLTYNFEKDKVMAAIVGAVMLSATETYKDDVSGTVLETIETTFTYWGKQGKVIKIFYCEASDNFDRPPVTQELTYDITDDSIITFRNTRIRVLDATKSMIAFVVLESPAFKDKNGAKIQ